MSSPQLLALQSAINTNTLSAGQQAALSEALDAIIPFFPVPDELSNSIPATEPLLAREWIASLYAIQAGVGGPVVTPARVVTPTEETILPAPFQPGALGKVLLVADVTPTRTGLLLVSVNVTIVEDAAGVPGLALFFVDDLTGITGGTLLSPGLTAEPTSTTPAFSAGVPVFAVEEPSFDDGSNPHNAIVQMASVPVQAVVGHRTGIIVVGRDTGTQNWTAMAAAVSVVELGQ
jgi:hypothetical protein